MFRVPINSLIHVTGVMICYATGTSTIKKSETAEALCYDSAESCRKRAARSIDAVPAGVATGSNPVFPIFYSVISAT